MKKLAIVIVGAIPMLSYAALGGTPPSASSISNNSRLNSTVVSTPNTQYVREVKSSYVSYTSTGDKACVIKQLATLPDKTGSKVFAVLWHCPSIPDLRSLLTEQYFDVFKTKPTINTLTYRKYVTDNLVTELSGHQGDSHGNAYLTNQVPNNVSIRELLINEKI